MARCSYRLSESAKTDEDFITINSAPCIWMRGIDMINGYWMERRGKIRDLHRLEECLGH